VCVHRAWRDGAFIPPGRGLATWASLPSGPAAAGRNAACARKLPFRPALSDLPAGAWGGGKVRKAETGTSVCHAVRFTPEREMAAARDQDREARQVALLKRSNVFNVNQCDGSREPLTARPDAWWESRSSLSDAR
jgi:hypothetical protein